MSDEHGLELPRPLEPRSDVVQGERSLHIRGLKKLLAINPEARDTEPVKVLIKQHNITDEELSS